MDAVKLDAVDVNEKHSDSHEDHHVRFDESIKPDDPEQCVTYQLTNSNIVIVHLGFLQVKHRYLIDLKLPLSLFKFEKEPTLIAVRDVDGENPVPNNHCKLIEFSCKETEQTNFYDIKIEYFAYKEKLLKEELKLMNEKNPEEFLTLIITARVLGKGMGTPMLRNGIHCVGIEEEANDENTSVQAVSETT